MTQMKTRWWPSASTCARRPRHKDRCRPGAASSLGEGDAGDDFAPPEHGVFSGDDIGNGVPPDEDDTAAYLGAPCKRQQGLTMSRTRAACRRRGRCRFDGKDVCLRVMQVRQGTATGGSERGDVIMPGGGV